MKHIGWCLDRIQDVMGSIPKEVISEGDKEKANRILDEVQKYADTLVQIIRNHDFRNRLHQLENTQIEGIKLQAREVEELFKDLEHMLYWLGLYIKELREMILNCPEQWYRKRDLLVHTIDEKFGGERGELRKVFQITLHTQEELQRIVTSEEHFAELLK